MKRFKMKAYLVLTLLLGVFLLPGCGNWEGDGDGGTNIIGATLTAIAVTPANPSIPVTTTTQFTATGTYSDGTDVDITALVAWSSVTQAKATVDASGLATGVAAGNSVITATSGTISGATTLTVTAATLSSIAVTPVNPTIVDGLTKQFTATGTYSDGTAHDITAAVIWSSATETFATVNSSGLATGLAAGTSNITATRGTTSGLSKLTVTTATLSSITVTPAKPSIVDGLTKQFTATGTYSDGSIANITASVVWSSATPAKATVNSTSGLATGIATGTSVITATKGTGILAKSGSTTLTVTAATLSTITVTPINPIVISGLTKQFAATGKYSDNSVADITALVTWSSATPAKATVNNRGLATGLAAGTSVIKATLGAKSGSTTLTVSAATLSLITVTPANPSVVNGQSIKFKANGTYSDSSNVDITASVIWSSATTTIATMNASGLATSGRATGIAVGTSRITATLGIKSGYTTLTVTAGLVNNPTAPNMGEIDRFVILASQRITTTTGSAITDGDLGIMDQARSYYAGFTVGAIAGQFDELTNGLSYAADDVTPPYVIPPPYASTVAFINQSRTDLGIVYSFLAADPNSGAPTQVCPIELGNLTLTRGVYKTAVDVTIQTGDLTLDAQGDPNSVWIFSIGGNLTTGAPGGNIILANGAQAKNVYWRTAGTTILGTGTNFSGNVFAWSQVNVLTGAAVTGRLFAVTDQVTLDANAVTKAP